MVVPRGTRADDAVPAAMNIAWTTVRLVSPHGHEEEAGAGRSAQAAGEPAAEATSAQARARAQARSATALPRPWLRRQRQARRHGRAHHWRRLEIGTAHV